jgi:large subunit ribosomal protein L22
MEVKAIAKYVRVQPRKVRIIADEVRGKNAEHVASLLRYHTSKSAKALRKVLISAMANAQENNNLSPESLKIATITVDEGPRLKRMKARAMGRGNRIVKKTSHITVIVEDAPIEKPVKPHGTKAKPRPTFATATKGKKGAAKAKKEEATAAPVEEVVAEQAEVVEEATPAEATEAPEEHATEEAPAEEAPAEQEETTPEADGSEEKGAEKE